MDFLCYDCAIPTRRQSIIPPQTLSSFSETIDVLAPGCERDALPQEAPDMSNSESPTNSVLTTSNMREAEPSTHEESILTSANDFPSAPTPLNTSNVSAPEHPIDEQPTFTSAFQHILETINASADVDPADQPSTFHYHEHPSALSALDTSNVSAVVDPADQQSTFTAPSNISAVLNPSDLSISRLGDPTALPIANSTILATEEPMEEPMEDGDNNAPSQLNATYVVMPAADTSHIEDHTPVAEEEPATEEEPMEDDSFRHHGEYNQASGDNPEDSMSQPEPVVLIPDEPLAYEIIPGGTVKGGDLLADNQGYTYSRSRKRPRVTTWCCSNRGRKCPATVRQIGDSFKPGGREHNHTSNSARTLHARARAIVSISYSFTANLFLFLTC